MHRNKHRNPNPNNDNYSYGNGIGGEIEGDYRRTENTLHDSWEKSDNSGTTLSWHDERQEYVLKGEHKACRRPFKVTFSDEDLDKLKSKK